ncbi:hypothetical protein [Sphingomonas oryzagri]
MSAFLVPPLDFTVVASSSSSIAPASDLGLDEPGMTWRSNGLSGAYVLVQLNGSPWDTIALVGNNCLASDTIRVRAADSQAATLSDPVIDITFNAWSGVAPSADALSVYAFPEGSNAAFVRIDVLSGASQGFVEASRLVIGKRVECDGVDIGAEQSFEDGSTIDEGPGYTDIDRYGVRVQWKLTCSGIRELPYYRDWAPFLRYVGKSRAFVIVPEYEGDYLQQQACFARMTQSAKGAAVSGDIYNIDLQMLSVS